MTAYYKVFDIADEIEERVSLTDIQITNIDILLEEFLVLPISQQFNLNYVGSEHILEELIKSDRNRRALDEFSNLFAERLYHAETIEEKEGARRRNKNIKQGIFIIKYDAEKVIFLKLEEIKTINPEDFSRSSTYSGERDYYKIATMPFQQEGEILVDIIDANPRVAKYWSDSFLNLTPARNSEKNTEDLISLIKNDDLINDLTEFENIIVQETVDKFLLEKNNFSFNSLLHYFNKEQEKDYELNEFYENQALRLIDESFDLHRDSIDKYFKRVYKLNEQVKINIDNILEALAGGQIEYDKENRLIKVPISVDFDIEKEMPELL